MNSKPVYIKSISYAQPDDSHIHCTIECCNGTVFMACADNKDEAYASAFGMVRRYLGTIPKPEVDEVSDEQGRRYKMNWVD